MSAGFLSSTPTFLFHKCYVVVRLFFKSCPLEHVHIFSSAFCFLYFISALPAKSLSALYIIYIIIILKEKLHVADLWSPNSLHNPCI